MSKLQPGVGSVPPMPEGFTDSTAWDAIHFVFSRDGTSALDVAVIEWQKANQDRVRAASKAATIAAIADRER